jgi:putative ABC transport system permease protein
LKDQDEYLENKPEGFIKDSKRWVIFPKLSFANHQKIVARNETLEEVFSAYQGNDIKTFGEKSGIRLGVAASGISYAYAKECLGAKPPVRLIRVATAFPFPEEFIVKALEGVREVTGQFYLTSLSESCCDFPVQIIGFDPDSDFLIRPWVRQYATDGRPFFAGSNVNVKDGSVSFFSKKHSVGAKLAKSGTGMDNSVFTDLSGVREIFDDAKEKGFCFLSDGDMATKTSAVYVRLEDGVKADTAALRIRQAVSGVQVIQQGKFLRTFADKMNSIVFILWLLAALFLMLTVIALALTFSLTMFERKREFSILRVLGASRPQLASVILGEASLLGAAGAACGVFLSALALLPFSVLIAQKLDMPFCLPPVWQMILFAVSVLLILTAACVLSALHSAVRIARLEIYTEAK